MKDKSTLLIGSNLRYGLNIFDCHHYSLNSLLRSLKRPWLKNQFSSILIHLFYFIILLKTLYINQENICKQIEIWNFANLFLLTFDQGEMPPKRPAQSLPKCSIPCILRGRNVFWRSFATQQTLHFEGYYFIVIWNLNQYIIILS